MNRCIKSTPHTDVYFLQRQQGCTLIFLTQNLFQGHSAVHHIRRLSTGFHSGLSTSISFQLLMQRHDRLSRESYQNSYTTVNNLKIMKVNFNVLVQYRSAINILYCQLSAMFREDKRSKHHPNHSNKYIFLNFL